MSTDTDYAHTGYARQARTEKAVAIEARLRELGIPLAAARTLPDASRRRVARDAGVRPGSEETWQQVFRYLADHELHHPPPQQLVTTSCAVCGATITVPLELFERRSQVAHDEVGGECDGRYWR